MYITCTYIDIDILPVLYRFGTGSEVTLMAAFRSLITGLTMTGRDARILDSAKAKTVCHKAAVKV